MKIKVQMPKAFSWDNITTNPTVRKIFESDLAVYQYDKDDEIIDESRPDSPPSEDVTLAESYLLIDEYCKLTGIPTGLYLTLTTFIESGNGPDCVGYGYEPELIDNTLMDYIKEQFKQTIFAKVIDVSREKYSVDISVVIPEDFEDKEYGDYLQDLFAMLSTVHNYSELSEMHRYRKNHDNEDLAFKVKTIVEKAVSRIPTGHGHVFTMKNGDVVTIFHPYLMSIDTLHEDILKGEFDYDIEIDNGMRLVYENAGKNYPDDPYTAENWW